MKYQSISAYDQATHFHKILQLMNFLDQQIEQQLADGGSAKINKRAIYYSMLKTFPKGQADLDDRIFEVCQLVGNVPRKYFGISATSKGMMTGIVLSLFKTELESDDIIDHVSIPSDESKQSRFAKIISEFEGLKGIVIVEKDTVF